MRFSLIRKLTISMPGFPNLLKDRPGHHRTYTEWCRNSVRTTSVEKVDVPTYWYRKGLVPRLRLARWESLITRDFPCQWRRRWLDFGGGGITSGRQGNGFGPRNMKLSRLRLIVFLFLREFSIGNGQFAGDIPHWSKFIYVIFSLEDVFENRNVRNPIVWNGRLKLSEDSRISYNLIPVVFHDMRLCFMRAYSF